MVGFTFICGLDGIAALQRALHFQSHIEKVSLLRILFLFFSHAYESWRFQRNGKTKIPRFQRGTFSFICGLDGTRTRDLRRDRAAF